MSNNTKNYILIIAGVVAAVFGIMGAIPSYLQGNYGWGVLATILIITGLVLLAIAFGE